MSKTSYSDFADGLREKCDIVTVVAEHVALKRKGKNYWGCCPFHGEKTPSFSVNKEKNLFYCFGCHAGGNVYNFLMKMYNLSFGEAVKTLAEKMGVDMPTSEQELFHQKKKQEHEVLYNAVSLASDFFQACLLKSSYGVEALTYLENRKLNTEIIKKFKIGFAPPLWDRLGQEMQKKGFLLSDLFKAGLVKLKNDGMSYNDVFRARVIFPISNEQGKVVAFGGRAIAETVQPKYLNSNDTEIFNKRKILFGLYEAKEAIRLEKFVFVVEGYMDVVAMQAHGIENVVASLGTAFTAEQARQISAKTARVLLAYDNDEAGKNAAIRAGDAFKDKDIDVKVLLLEGAKDPDEFLNKFGLEKFRECAKKAKPFLDYKVESVLAKYDLRDENELGRAIREVISALQESTDAITAELYLSKIAKQFNISEMALKAESEKTFSKGMQTQVRQRKQVVDENTLDRAVTRIMNSSNASTLAERNLVYHMLNDVALARYIGEQLQVHDFTDSRAAIVARVFADELVSDNIRSLLEVFNAQAFESLPAEEFKELSCIMMYDYEYYFVDFLKNIDECIRQIKINSLERQIFVLVKEADLFMQTDEDRYTADLEKIRSLNYELAHWKSKEC